MLYSPNGEPLNGGVLGRPLCKDAYRDWFEKIDVSHTGRIDFAAFGADAERLFQQMDTERDGVLTPSELENARFPYRQTALDQPREEKKDDRKTARSRSRDEEPSQRNGRGAQRDPIMAADTNLDFKVTREEYRAQTAKTFAALDRGHKGYITVDDLASYCSP
jgi:hypothetical protein